MSSTPAHVATLRSQLSANNSFDWKGNVSKVRELFRERKFKQCARTCGTVIIANPTIHPLHKAFFHFYKAVSDESLGAAAHKFSRNKVMYLEAARDAFISALEQLSEPLTISKVGIVDMIANLPDFPRLTPASKELNTSTSTETSTSRSALRLTHRSSSISSHYSEYETAAAIDLASDANHLPYPPPDIVEAELMTGTSATDQGNNVSPARSSHQSSACSSSKSLVPSPLFNQKARSFNPREVIQTPRTLPRLPFNHTTSFQMQGTRVTQQPALRNTTQLSAPIADVPHTPCPMTPRFNLIRDTFATTPLPNTHLTAFLSSADTTRYSDQLLSFRTRLCMHIEEVSHQITLTQEIQHQHFSEKQQEGIKQVTSHWLLKPISPNGNRNRIEHQRRLSGGPRNIGGGSGAGGIPRTTSSIQGFDGIQRLHNEERDRSARIERLRARGWFVRKEHHGWKGREYYDNLERAVMGELEDGPV